MSPERTTTASSRRDRFAVLSSAMTRLLHNLTYTTLPSCSPFPHACPVGGGRSVRAKGRFSTTTERRAAWRFAMLERGPAFRLTVRCRTPGIARHS